jgi:hypothetical protein
VNLGLDEIWDPTAGTQIPPEEDRPTSYEIQRTKQLLITVAKRKLEALRLYEPLPTAERFHSCKAPEVLVYGSNRAGKSLATLAEAARALTGQDPYDKYPKRDGRCIFVAMSGKLIAEKIYRTLFRAGAFKVIRDPYTKEWRVFKPRDPVDEVHAKMAKPVPPLIPPRFIAEIAWENRAQQIPNVVRLTNGWEILFLTNGMEPLTSIDIDLAIFDEEIANALWYSETAARLIDRGGRFIWGATPQYATETMFDLYQRSEDSDTAPVRGFYMNIYENHYLSEANVKTFVEKFEGSDYDRTVRVEGHFAMIGYRVYSEWNAATHLVEPFAIPPSWTRYLAIDPGYDVTAVLLGAVPPDDDDDWKGSLILYRELYLKKCGLSQFGDAMQRSTKGENFETFIIDHEYSRQTDQSTGKVREQLLAEALEEVGVRPMNFGTPFFVWGSTDHDAGRLQVIEAMRIGKTGRPRLRAFKGCLPSFDDEIAKYVYSRDKDGTMLKKPKTRHDHLMDCMRILVASDPQYVHPKKHGRFFGGPKQYLQQKQRLRQQHAMERGETSRFYVHMGPGP